MSRFLWVMVLSGALMACANQSKIRDRELSQMGDWLPGQYDNSAQVDEDLQQGVEKIHPALEMNVVPVFAPFIGDLVVYAEMVDTKISRRVVSQKLYRFDKSNDEKFVAQRVFDFKEPARWTRGTTHPEIFRSLVLDDMTATSACDLKWREEGEKFIGTAGRKGCGIREMSFDGLELNIEQSGRAAGDVLRFRRVGVEE